MCVVLATCHTCYYVEHCFGYKTFTVHASSKQKEQCTSVADLILILPMLDAGTDVREVPASSVVLVSALYNVYWGCSKCLTRLLCGTVLRKLAVVFVSVLKVTVLRGVLTNATLYFILLPSFLHLRLTFALVLISFFLFFLAQKMKKETALRFVLAISVQHINFRFE